MRVPANTIVFKMCQVELSFNTTTPCHCDCAESFATRVCRCSMPFPQSIWQILRAVPATVPIQSLLLPLSSHSPRPPTIIVLSVASSGRRACPTVPDHVTRLLEMCIYKVASFVFRLLMSSVQRFASEVTSGCTQLCVQRWVFAKLSAPVSFNRLRYQRLVRADRIERRVRTKGGIVLPK